MAVLGCKNADTWPSGVTDTPACTPAASASTRFTGATVQPRPGACGPVLRAEATASRSHRLPNTGALAAHLACPCSYPARLRGYGVSEVLCRCLCAYLVRRGTVEPVARDIQERLCPLLQPIVLGLLQSRHFSVLLSTEASGLAT